jgi:hypothetical protein
VQFPAGSREVTVAFNFISERTVYVTRSLHTVKEMGISWGYLTDRISYLRNYYTDFDKHEIYSEQF